MGSVWNSFFANCAINSQHIHIISVLPTFTTLSQNYGEFCHFLKMLRRLFLIIIKQFEVLAYLAIACVRSQVHCHRLKVVVFHWSCKCPQNLGYFRRLIAEEGFFLCFHALFQCKINVRNYPILLQIFRTLQSGDKAA